MVETSKILMGGVSLCWSRFGPRFSSKVSRLSVNLMCVCVWLCSKVVPESVFQSDAKWLCSKVILESVFQSDPVTTGNCHVPVDSQRSQLGISLVVGDLSSRPTIACWPPAARNAGACARWWCPAAQRPRSPRSWQNRGLRCPLIPLDIGVGVQPKRGS